MLVVPETPRNKVGRPLPGSQGTTKHLTWLGLGRCCPALARKFASPGSKWSGYSKATTRQATVLTGTAVLKKRIPSAPIARLPLPTWKGVPRRFLNR